MLEILAMELDSAVTDIGVLAKKAYQGKEYQVWELDKKEFEKLCRIPDEEWKDNWGMWRSAKGSNMRVPEDEYMINNHLILAWDGSARTEVEDDEYYLDRSYANLLEYFSNELGASQPRNVCALAIDLARANGITMAELFSRCQE